jgi:RNA polymerase sigma-70 factor (ECF subfamily)
VTDAQVIQEVLDGHDSAFRILVQRYQNQVASTVIGMLGHCAEADDVGQEVFIRFYKALKNFRGDSSVGTYLTRIAINLSLNELNRRKRKFRLFSKPDQDLNEIPSNDVINVSEGDMELIEKALEMLEPKFKSVIVLRLIDGYSTEETARILKLPQGTVLSRLSRAQVKLKQKLSLITGDGHEWQTE